MFMTYIACRCRVPYITCTRLPACDRRRRSLSLRRLPRGRSPASMLAQQRSASRCWSCSRPRTSNAHRVDDTLRSSPGHGAPRSNKDQPFLRHCPSAVERHVRPANAMRPERQRDENAPLRRSHAAKQQAQRHEPDRGIFGGDYRARRVQWASPAPAQRPALKSPPRTTPIAPRRNPDGSRR